MNTAILLLASTTLGVDIGWQPVEGGGFEYIIQLEPQLLDALRRGEQLGSDIPASVARNLRSFRVVLGTERVPRIGDPSAAPPEPAVVSPPAATGADADAPPGANTPTPAESGNPFDGRWQPPAEMRRGSPPDIQTPDANASARREGSAEEQPALPPDRYAAAGAHTFSADPSSQPIANAAGYREEGRPRYGNTRPSNSFVNTNPTDGTKPPAKASAGQGTAAPAAESKPWFPFTVAVMGLFVSLGGNMYLGSLAWGYRNRCLALIGRGSRAGRKWPPNRFEEEDEDQDVQAVEDD